MDHLAIMKKGYIEKILRGEKTIESRFSVHKITPHERIQAGEKVYLQEVGKMVTASFEVGKVLFFRDLDERKIDRIRAEYGTQICADVAFWDAKKHARYATLIFVKNPTLEEPFRVHKRDRSAFKTILNIRDLM